MNCLITKRGRIIDCDGNKMHDVICERVLKVKLRTFLLEQGGIRIKQGWSDSETLAIECHTKKPTPTQQAIIQSILRENDYYTIVLNFRTITKFRPIRGFEF